MTAHFPYRDRLERLLAQRHIEVRNNAAGWFHAIDMVASRQWVGAGPDRDEIVLRAVAKLIEHPRHP